MNNAGRRGHGQRDRRSGVGEQRDGHLDGLDVLVGEQHGRREPDPCRTGIRERPAAAELAPERRHGELPRNELESLLERPRPSEREPLRVDRELEHRHRQPAARADAAVVP